MAGNERERYEQLLMKEQENPGDLSVQRELLLLGDHWKKDRKNPDPSLIKCYLFHVFEHPESHSEAQQKKMAREFFDAPRLKKCLALAKDPEAFMKEYLGEMAREYVDIFIWHQKEHVPSLFGFVPPKRIPLYLSLPMGDVIRNIFLCPFLSVAEQQLLSGAFYRACYGFLNGQTEHLDENLGAEVRALIV
ncbi:MAG: hypothetical protein E7329_03760 [Clostridiales bacterium]|nr:hypothetical protein [Clostridiales bacterium]